MTFEFRVADAGDLDLVVTITEAAYAPWTAAFGAAPLPVTEDYAPWIERGQVQLLLDSGAVVGLLAIELLADHAMIFSIALRPEAQGRGLGLVLLRRAEELALAKGLREVRLYTNGLMTRNIELYRRHGYVETGRSPNPRRPGWVKVDMAKAI